MTKQLRLLHIEDNPADADLVQNYLRATGLDCQITRAVTLDKFREELTRTDLDLILSDFTLIDFDGFDVLTIARRERPQVPFIFLTGTMGEDFAVEAIKRGATDYILKDRLSRLPSSIQRALREAREHAERRQMEEQIREQAALLDQAQNAIFRTDIGRQILYWNKGAERLYGWNSAAAIGTQADKLLYQDELPPPREAMQVLLAQGEWQGELHQITREGQKVTVESHWTLMRDEAGAPKSILMISADVTRKRQMEARFFRNQRLESIGALAGGIAHDLNNALTPILMGMDLLRAEKLSPAGAHMVSLMSKSARHGADMVSQILSFSRGAAGQHTEVNVSNLVSEIVTLASETFPRSIKIQASVTDDLAAVVGNPTQLHQVLLNLFVNARDAMPRGGCLSIEAAGVVLDMPELPGGPAHSPGAYMRLSVADTGHGIPAELLDKIFEPFFTTKAQGNGTGLGLFTVTEIIKSHGGFLKVSSEVSRGTTFRIFLPARVAARGSSVIPGAPQILPGRGERILLVDDEIAILELTKLTLETFNYEVLTARNGAEGMEIYEQYNDVIDLIITDMMMPVMDGPEMIRNLRAKDPGLKIIGVSGLGSGYINKRTNDVRTDAFLKKPFSTEQLLKAIRWVLDPAPTVTQPSSETAFWAGGKGARRHREAPALS